MPISSTFSGKDLRVHIAFKHPVDFPSPDRYPHCSHFLNPKQNKISCESIFQLPIVGRLKDFLFLQGGYRSIFQLPSKATTTISTPGCHLNSKGPRISTAFIYILNKAFHPHTQLLNDPPQCHYQEPGSAVQKSQPHLSLFASQHNPGLFRPSIPTSPSPLPGFFFFLGSPPRKDTSILRHWPDQQPLLFRRRLWHF